MDKFPSITTERLILDRVKKADIQNIVRYADNIKITETTRTMPHPYVAEDASAWIERIDEGFKNKDQFAFALRKKSDAEFIGSIGLTINLENNRAELGYWIAESHWNKGYTTEAVKAILEFGFNTLKLNKIIAVYLTTNEASGKVMLKNGMVKEATFKDHDVKKDHTVADGLYVSLIQYRLTKNEYETLKNA